MVNTFCKCNKKELDFNEAIVDTIRKRIIAYFKPESEARQTISEKLIEIDGRRFAVEIKVRERYYEHDIYDIYKIEE